MLAIRPVALPRESPGSLFLRAASANGWTPSSLLQAYPDQEKVRKDFGVVIGSAAASHDLAHKLGIDSASINAVTYRQIGPTKGQIYAWMGVAVKASHLRLHTPQVCPACLAADEFPYARAVWDHRLVSSCKTHMCALVDTCPSCAKPLSWNRPEVEACHCGFDLRMAPLIPADGAEHQIVDTAVAAADDVTLDRATIVLDMLHELARAGALASSVTSLPAVLGRLVEQPETLPLFLTGGVGGAGLSPRVALRRLLSMPHWLFAERMLAALDLHSYQNIPGNWDALLAETLSYQSAAVLTGQAEITITQFFRKQKKDGTGPGIPTVEAVNTLLRKFSNLVEEVPEGYGRPRPLHGLAMHAVVSAVEDGLASIVAYQHRQGLPSVRVALRIREAASSDIERMNLREVARAAQVNYEIIRGLAHSGFLKLASPLPGKKIFSVLRRDGEAFLKDYCFAGPLARTVGASTTTFSEKLMAAGVKPAAGPTVDGSLTYVFRRDEVAKVDLYAVANIDSYPTRAGRPKSGVARQVFFGVSYSDAAEELGTLPCRIRQLINVQLLARDASSRGRPAVTRTSLTLFRAMLRSSEHVSVEDAAKEIGESAHQFRRRWVHTGLVQERNLLLVRQIPRDDLKKIQLIKGDYMTRDEMGARVNKDRTHVANRIKIGQLASDGILVGGASKIWLHPRSAISDAYNGGLGPDPNG